MKAVRLGVDYLNDVLDEGIYLHPLSEQRDCVRQWRQIGLGIMGLADALIKMRIKYGSPEAVEFCDQVGSFMADTAINESAVIAQHRCPYDMFSNAVLDSMFYLYNVSDETDSLVRKHGLHNSQLLTIAPTGTISTMLGISGGIEPIFARSYTRKTESLHGEDVYYKVYTPIVAQYLREHNLTDESQLPDWFVTSAEIAPVDRVQMQAAWQAHIDASISSTVNLPNEATVEDVKEIYMAAWKDGLKGITVFRDGCKRTGVLTTGKKEQTEPPVTAAEIATGSTSHPPLLIDPDMIRRGLMRGEIVECSDNLVGKKRKLTTGCGSLHVLAYFDKETGDMMEVYLAKGSTGGCANFMTGLSRTISLLCRAGVSVYDIKDQLDSTGSCPSYATRSATKHDTSKGACCPMAIGNALIEMYEEMHRETIRTAVVTAETEIERTTNTTLANETPYVDGLQCPECGATLRHEGGCDLCEFCGWSHCG